MNETIRPREINEVVDIALSWKTFLEAGVVFSGLILLFDVIAYRSFTWEQSADAVIMFSGAIAATALRYVTRNAVEARLSAAMSLLSGICVAIGVWLMFS